MGRGADGKDPVNVEPPVLISLISALTKKKAV